MKKLLIVCVAALAVPCNASLFECSDARLAASAGGVYAIQMLDAMARRASDAADINRLKNASDQPRRAGQRIYDWVVGSLRELVQLGAAGGFAALGAGPPGWQLSVVRGTAGAALLAQIADMSVHAISAGAFNLSRMQRALYERGVQHMTDAHKRELVQLQASLKKLSMLRASLQGVSAAVTGASLPVVASGLSFAGKEGSPKLGTAVVPAGMLSLLAMRIASIQYQLKYRAWVRRMIAHGKSVVE